MAFTTIGAIVAVASELSDPELEPVALLWDYPAGIAGFMVADTSDHVYLSPILRHDARGRDRPRRRPRGRRPAPDDHADRSQRPRRGRA